MRSFWVGVEAAAKGEESGLPGLPPERTLLEIFTKKDKFKGRALTSAFQNQYNHS
jgi:hypothetical protein